MRQSSSDAARRNFRKLLNEVEAGQCVEIQRYGSTAAIVVPPDWFARAKECLGEPIPVPDKTEEHKQ